MKGKENTAAVLGHTFSMLKNFSDHWFIRYQFDVRQYSFAQKLITRT
jgi:hypothetical protein